MSRDRPSARIAILSRTNSRSDRVHEIVRRMGWRTEVLDPWSSCQDFSTGRWELIVLLADDVDPETLKLVSEVSVPSSTRVLVVADNRDPQVVADVLRAGSDDYVAEPVEAEELAARMQSLVLRARDLTERRQDGTMVVDTSRRVISAGPWKLHFSPREWDLLMALIDNPGITVSPENLARKLDLRDSSGTHIPSIVSRIRRKFRRAGFEALRIETVHGRGYLARFRRAADSMAVRPFGRDDQEDSAR